MSTRISALGTFVLGLYLALALPSIASAVPIAWSTKAPMPTPRSAHIAEAVGGMIYAGQGAGAGLAGQFYRYDPSLDTWAPRSMPSDTYSRASAVLGGTFLAFGGVEHGGPLSRVDAYDPTTDTWTPRTGMPTPRSGPAATVVGGKAYVMGGSHVFGSNPGTTANEAYDPLANTWSVLAPMPRSRQNPSIAAVGGKIYVFGGMQFCCPPPTIFDIVDVFDPSTDLWSTLATPMPRPRTMAGIGVIDGKILLMGGYNLTDGVLASVEEFDPLTGLWAEREPMPTARVSLAATVADGLVYAIGGETTNPSGGALFLSTVEAYDPSKDPSRVPEPGTLLLLASGMVGLGVWRARRNR